MEIRRFHDSDISQMVSLFYDTVHSINVQDYSQEQLDVWAPKGEETLKLTSWKNSLSNNVTFVAVIKGKIVGFSDLTRTGYLDRLYIHKDFQRQGIAKALVNKLEAEARRIGLSEINTDSSITAKPFFERCGYRVIQPQTVERRNVKLVNFKMSKELTV